MGNWLNVVRAVLCYEVTLSLWLRIRVIKINFRFLHPHRIPHRNTQGFLFTFLLHFGPYNFVNSKELLRLFLANSRHADRGKFYVVFFKYSNHPRVLLAHCFFIKRCCFSEVLWNRTHQIITQSLHFILSHLEVFLDFDEVYSQFLPRYPARFLIKVLKSVSNSFLASRIHADYCFTRQNTLAQVRQVTGESLPAQSHFVDLAGEISRVVEVCILSEGEERSLVAWRLRDYEVSH